MGRASQRQSRRLWFRNCVCSSVLALALFIWVLSLFRVAATMPYQTLETKLKKLNASTSLATTTSLAMMMLKPEASSAQPQEALIHRDSSDGSALDSRAKLDHASKSSFWRATRHETSLSDAKAVARRDRVKEAALHAWRGYKQKAWGHDEIQPSSGKFLDSWGGMGMQILDSLDTLWLLGMREEFEEAKRWVESPMLDFHKVGTVSVFETTIRALGGLLSAHALSGESIFKQRAQELGDCLMLAFRSPKGLAHPWISLKDGQIPPKKDKTSIAEAGSLQLEFARLSEVTGDPKYKVAAAAAHDLFYSHFKSGHTTRGLFPVHVAMNDGSLSGRFSFGASGDSFYEYLLKCWLMGGRVPGEPLVEMYEASLIGLRETMLHISRQGGLRYVSGQDNKMEHLACFLPGLLALGAHARLEAVTRDAEFGLAEELARTCFEMYNRTATGLAPESVIFNKVAGSDFVADKPNSMWNLLRPEAVESFFILHELTGDPKYRDWGHYVFEAFERRSKTTFGYGAHPDVTRLDSPCCLKNDDKEPTFFVAETLKYLYLLQDPDHIVSLDHYVLTTEAHPLPMQFGKIPP